MSNDNLKDKIDQAAEAAKAGAEKAGKAVHDAASKLADKTEKAADSIKDAGDKAGKKLGA